MMKKSPILLLFLLSGTLTSCRLGTHPNAHDLIDAENRFAELSRATNTRQAFLTYLTDSTVLFHAGAIVTGRESWQERPADSSLLFWWPTFVGISRAGDLGFSSGPWQWSPDRHANRQSQAGYFVSMWQYSPRSHWKLAADIGTSLRQPEENPRGLHIVTTGENESTSSLSTLAFLAMDTVYLAQLNSTHTSYQRSFLSAQARLLRQGLPPFDFPALPNEQGVGYHFRIKGGRIAKTGDLGFAYGTVFIDDPNSDPSARQFCYLRVWRKEKGVWKVILDVIG